MKVSKPWWLALRYGIYCIVRKNYLSMAPLLTAGLCHCLCRAAARCPAIRHLPRAAAAGNVGGIEGRRTWLAAVMMTRK